MVTTAMGCWSSLAPAASRRQTRSRFFTAAGRPPRLTPLRVLPHRSADRGMLPAAAGWACEVDPRAGRCVQCTGRSPTALGTAERASTDARRPLAPRRSPRQRGCMSYLRRLALEAAVLVAVITVVAMAGTQDADAARRWDWPLAPLPVVLAGFRPPASDYGPGHRGVDLAGRAGQSVLAAGAGRIGFAGRIAGRGVVTVIHGALRTTYEPVRSTRRVGEAVGAGERIGRLEPGRGHCPGRVCLHWGLLRGATYLNPLLLFGYGHARLLPVLGVPAPPSSRPPGVLARVGTAGHPDRRGRGWTSGAAATVLGGAAGVAVLRRGGGTRAPT